MGKILKYTDYKDYFKSIADGMKALNPEEHGGYFYEFNGMFKGNNLMSPAMVLVPPVSNPTGEADNEFKRMVGEVMILYTVGKENTVDLNLKLQDAENIVEQIIAKMKKDWGDYSLGSSRPIYQLELDRLEYEQVGPVGDDNRHGYSLKIEFSNPNRYIIDTDQWW